MSRRRAWFAGALLAGSALGLVGCQPQPIVEESAPPFVFRELNLRQQDPQGRPLWEIRSPETRYDLSRRIAQARQLTGTLYRDGKPLYELSASTAVVVNDGEVVQLEGPTRLRRLDPERPAELTALRVRWYPAEQRMEIDRSPRLVQGDLQLSAQLARFRIDTDRLELRSSPLLQQQGPEPLRLAVGPLDWQADTGAITARGPVQGERRLADGGVQRLTAPALSGNSQAQTVDLQAPVRFEEPGRKAWVDAGLTQLNLQRQTARSGVPFRAGFGKTQLRGDGFELDLGADTVRVQGSCLLRQPTDQLQARSCQWNWTTGAATATGGVVLQRQAGDQDTRAERLSGRIGDDGFAEFSSPAGGRVRTQFNFRSDSADPALPGAPPERSPQGPPTPPFQL